MANKVQFGIKNLTYSVITVGTTGYTYGTPVAVPGAVSLSVDVAGDQSTFYADNIPYYLSQSNNGYTGSIEIAKVPDALLIDIFGEVKDTNGVLLETAGAEAKAVALMFQIDGNEENDLFVFYNVALNRPGYSTTTISESKEPQTQSMDFTALPSSDPDHFGVVKGKTTDTTSTATRSGWFTSVYEGPSL